jgi:hypothetical protein
MRFWALIVTLAILASCQSVPAMEIERLQMRDDFGTAALQDCFLQYYYFIPCPSYSWFWGIYDWECNSRVGAYFVVGDASTGGLSTCNPQQCMQISGVRVLDFFGLGSVYPGLFTVEFDVYCSDEFGCPIGPSLWNSGPVEVEPNWDVIPITPALSVAGCAVDPGPPASSPRILVTAKHIGTDCTYPQWAMDDISDPLLRSCQMHDKGCLTALYPRPASSHYDNMHSGYYGVDFEHCPPQWFRDGLDSTIGADLYGYVELAWRILLVCPNPTESTTWGDVKSLYR